MKMTPFLPVLLIIAASFSMTPNEGFFIPNRGQWSDVILYGGSCSSGQVWILSDGTLLSDDESDCIDQATLELFNDLGRELQIVDGEPAAGRYNYFLGSDPDGWITDVPGLSSLECTGPEIGRVLLRFENGMLVHDDGGSPQWQSMEMETDILMQVSPAYSTYLGGQGQDRSYSIAVDAQGSAYVTGRTDSSDFPLQDPYQSSFGGGTYDVFVTKFSPDGTQLVYSTYIGGSQADNGYGIKLDSSGSAYVTGQTGSSNFPLVGALQSSYGGGATDAFVLKLSPAGNALMYSTYLGGSGDEIGRDLAVTSAGITRLAGSTTSTDFPLASPLQPTPGGGTYDAYVSSISPDGGQLVFSTYLGGSGEDYGEGVFVFEDGRTLVTGRTASANFPLQDPVQGSYGGGSFDGFLSALPPAGTTLEFSTFIGGSDMDISSNVYGGGDGDPYVAGETASSDFPLQNPFQGTLPGSSAAFVSRIESDGSALVFSTYLGGSGLDQARDIAVDTTGCAYITGYTSSTDMPVINAFQPGYAGGANDVFAARFVEDGSQLHYCTYIGGSGNDSSRGIAVDVSGAAYMTGGIASTDFPVQNPFQGSSGGSVDCYVTKFYPYSLSVEWGLQPAAGISFPSLYPNPFTHSLGIMVEMESQGPLSLSVFDMSGRRVQTILSGEQVPAGTSLFRWSPSGIPSGVYLLRADSESASAFAKVILARDAEITD